jgi:transglutaminase/protease-like cytokinesis protein 3
MSVSSGLDAHGAWSSLVVEGANVMKAKKAHKRLAKIEAWMSKVRDQYSASAPNLQNVLQAATAAIARAKEAVSLQASSGTKAASAKARRVAKKASPSQKNAVVTGAAANASTAKTARKSTTVQKEAKKRAAKKTAPNPVGQAATASVAQ